MAQSPHVASSDIEQALADKMAQIALKEKEQETQQKANNLGLGYINLVGFPIGPETIAVIPQEESQNLSVVCFLKTQTDIRIATVEPNNEAVQALAQRLAEKHRAHVEMYVISPHSFDVAFENYKRLPRVIKRLSGIAIAQEDIERYRQSIQDFRHLDDALKEASLSEAFTIILAGAIVSNASDIHIEAEDTGK